MRDRAAQIRAGLVHGDAPATEPDHRIRVDTTHLRSLESRARRLSFLPRQPANSVLNGRRASRLRGRGLNFEELRGYLPGDDVRSIDWKVTARTGEPHVRVFTEERDRPALLVVDQRMSMFFGSRHNMKSVTAVEAGALAAFRILDQGDRIGAIIFGDTQLVEIRPRRSKKTLDTIISTLARMNSELTSETPTVEPMPLNRPLEAVARIARRDHLIILITDGDGIDERTRFLLGSISRHNDIIVALVTDPAAHAIPEGLRLVISDGTLQAEIRTENPVVRGMLSEMSDYRLAEVLAWQTVLGVPVLPLSAGEETVPQIRRLMGLPRSRR
jgi:uncharacterized protein (DUF58 family)